MLSSTDDATLLSFKKGELIIIIKDNEFSQQRGWIKGQNERTKQTGAVPTDAIVILPTLSKPTNEVMVRTCLMTHPPQMSYHAQNEWSIKRDACFFISEPHQLVSEPEEGHHRGTPERNRNSGENSSYHLEGILHGILQVFGNVVHLTSRKMLTPTVLTEGISILFP